MKYNEKIVVCKYQINVPFTCGVLSDLILRGVSTLSGSGLDGFSVKFKKYIYTAIFYLIPGGIGVRSTSVNEKSSTLSALNL